MHFDEERLRSAFKQLASALEVLHLHRRVHRDIKPSKILVEPSGRLVLLDFGLVTPSELSLKSVDHDYPVGTIAYMAPEQATSQEISPKADWYSFGVLLFEALAGQLPFNGTYHQLLLAKRYEISPNPRDIDPAIPEDLADLSMALMSYHAAARPSARGDSFPLVLPDQHAETRGPVFVGRDREMNRILEAYKNVQENGFRAILVRGTSGFGKSKLLKTAGRMILEENPKSIVLLGRCNERESISFKAFDGVVDALSRNLLRISERELGRLTPSNVDLLTRVFPILSCLNDPSIVPFRQTRQEYDPQEVRSLAFTALREHLMLLFALHPVIIMIDDIQWADKDSFQLLRSLMQPPDSPAILFIMSIRTNPDVEAFSEVETWLSQLPLPLEKMDLEPLSPDASCLLAQELLETLPIPLGSCLPNPEDIALETAGHPFESPLVDLVELTCVSFGPLRQDAAAYALGVSVPEIFRMATQLKTQRLIRTTGPGAQDMVEPYHDRVREAVLFRMDPQIKITLRLCAYYVLRVTWSLSILQNTWQLLENTRKLRACL